MFPLFMITEFPKRPMFSLNFQGVKALFFIRTRFHITISWIWSPVWVVLWAMRMTRLMIYHIYLTYLTVRTRHFNLLQIKKITIKYLINYVTNRILLNLSLHLLKIKNSPSSKYRRRYKKMRLSLRRKREGEKSCRMISIMRLQMIKYITGRRNYMNKRTYLKKKKRSLEIEFPHKNQGIRKKRSLEYWMIKLRCWG